MHILKVSLIFIFLFPLISGWSQTGDHLTISFKIVDTANAPISFSDIYLLNMSDSSVAAASVPDENGLVEISAVPNNYIVLIETIEFDKKIINVSVTDKDIDLGTVMLNPLRTENIYNEVVIEREKNVMDLKIDKRIYNVAADINNQGATASEVLENIPSVTVDAEGNVSLRGNANVRILVDGKLSGFASTADALKMLQADAIDRIEVITNASSRYDAEGDAGIINIILKKEKNNGFNAILNVRTGYFHDHGAGIRLNYKKNKVNLFADYNFNYSKSPGNSTTYQRLSNADTQMTYFQTYSHEREKIRHNFRIGADYDWNSKNTTSFDINFRDGTGNNMINRIYDNYNADGVLYNTDTRIEDQTEDERLIETNISHVFNFSDKGTWRTALSYFFDKDYENSDYDEHSTYSGIRKIETSKALVNEEVLQFQSDFTYPFSKNGKLETGVRYQNRVFNNDFGYRMQVSPTEWESPDRFNDDVLYDEKIYAAYLMGSEVFGDWGVQAGLRAEYSDIVTWLKSTPEKNKNNYINFFPSAAVSYKLNEYSNIQWSLSRRIRRPGQWDLLPFMKFGDNREMRAGNPNLNPELTYSTELTWMRYLDRGSILGSVYYRRTTDKIERIAEYGNDGIIYRRALNIASSDAVGAELILTYQFFKWLRLNSNFNFYNQNISGEFNGESFDRSLFSWSNRTSMSISLPYDIKAQISGQYEAPRISPQGRILNMKWMDIAFSKDILKQKATIGFNIRDVFNSRRFRGMTETPEIYSESDFQWRPRSFMMTFTYRFNQTKRESERRDTFFESNDQME